MNHHGIKCHNKCSFEIATNSAIKGRMILFCILFTLMMSGCSADFESYVVRRMVDFEDEDYRLYEKMNSEGRLDQNGYYIDEDYLEDQPEFGNTSEYADTHTLQGSVHVTFANNCYLSIQYYLDSELMRPIDTNACYLNPNDCIYAAKPTYNSPPSNLYQFDGFRVYTYDNEGNRMLCSWGGDGDGLVLQVPMDCSVSEVSVEPIGRYEKRALLLHDYYVNNVGQEQELGGKWTINGKETTGTDFEISPAISYGVTYEYDTEHYYYVNSEPNSYYHQDGLVQFETVDPNSDITGYSVELQPYVKALLKVALTDSVKDIPFSVTTLGDSGNVTYADGKIMGNSFLGIGGTSDRIVFDKEISTNKGITIAADSQISQGYALRLEIVKTDDAGNSSTSIQYISDLPTQKTINVYEDGNIVSASTVYKEIAIKISRAAVVNYEQIQVENASIAVCLDGVSLEDGGILESSREVTVSIIPNEGYCIAGSKASNNLYCDTMKYSKWCSDYEKILKQYPVKKIWNVTLDFSDNYGTCTYKLDGQEINDINVELHEGQKLTLEYEITDSNYRIVRSGGIGGFFDNVFHKDTATYTIPISEDLDGTTIHRSDYINIERK